VLLVPGDTYATALQVERLEPLLTPTDRTKLERLGNMMNQHVDLDAIRALL
jgi:BioD-like phosphotransacetylase family protein